MTHGHHHPTRSHSRAFKIGIAVNLAYVVVEAGFGLVTGSVALLSDAGHNLTDVLALVVAWGATWLGGTEPTERRTYGLKRATIMASGVSALLLFVALGALISEAISRLGGEAATDGLTIMVVAGVGVVVNGVTAAMFLSGRHADLNVRGAFLHMAADAAVSLGVVAAGAVILFTGWYWVDPVIALVIAAVILVAGVGLFRDSLDLAMDAVPRHIDPAEVRAYLSARPEVTGVHHLHIWAMSTTETALTVHLVLRTGAPSDPLLQTLAADLRERFAIQHPTIQIERGSMAAECVAAAEG